nr:hypothetical protein [Tanacetum cinerariifolium]
MLDMTDFASWQQRIRLHYRGKDNGVCILKSIDEGPYKLRIFRETLAESTEGTPQFGPKRPRVYSDLKSEEKDRSELTKEDRESQLYDDFEHIRQHKEESIHDYYVRFAKLINDIRNIKMTMSKLQLNSKFVNNMLPEWGRFMTAVKLNRGLRDSNYDQLFAYLKQHEAHVMENKMLLECLSQPTVQPTADPLALLSNISNTQHGSPSSSTSSFTQIPPPCANSSSPADDLIENLTSTLTLLTQSYRTFLPQTNNQLRTSSNPENQATVQDGRVVVQNVQGRPNIGQGMNPQGGSAVGYGEAQNRVGNVNQGEARLGQARTAEDCDAFDSNVDEAPTAQTMFMANLSSADPITDEAGPSYDSDILSEVQDQDQYLDDTCAYHEEHVMHDSVQLDHVVDLHTDYTSVCNMILYDQYVKDNNVPVVLSNASSVQNDTFMMIYNDMCEPSTPSVSNSSRNAVVKNSLTAELATYREQVELYERRAKFELTKREQKINEQLRLVISERNFKEETLKRELHSTKLQLTSTINRNKSMVEETTYLKQDFKQKENKLLADFLNMKSLKEKAQPALYNGHEILKDNHAPAKVHNAEDTLEIAEITKKKMNAKITDPECVTYKVKISPHDYTKENLLATFTPQKQLTPEQIYWSNDLMKLKSEALKELAKVCRQIKAFTVYPPNTPATLVPKVLPTKSQVKIHIFTLIQMFLEFDKTCEKRITPTTITDGERGFEQTKACYLQEVIPFSKTIKDNFKGIQKALTKKHLKESIETIHEIVEEAKVVRPLDSLIVSTCCYTKHSQELLEYTIGTFLQDSHQRDKKHAPAPLIKKKQVAFAKQYDTSNSNTHKHVAKLNTQKTNVYVPPSTRVNCYIDASGSQPRSNTMKNRISLAKDVNKMKV